MKIFDRTFPSAEENLACDEALLDGLEDASGEVLRFWEAHDYFVVLGYSNEWRREINRPGADSPLVPVYRRVSGGGSVLQGPGCLNYSLILCAERHKDLAGVVTSNRFIMEKNRRALQKALGRPVEVRGITDLTLDGRKFSGNSQRRKKNGLLFHGTFLWDFDLNKIRDFLAMPPKEPSYREGRGHLDFLTNVKAGPDVIKQALCDEWQASGRLTQTPREGMRDLIREKYSDRDWHLQR